MNLLITAISHCVVMLKSALVIHIINRSLIIIYPMTPHPPPPFRVQQVMRVEAVGSSRL